jgi:hypothetical protein
MISSTTAISRSKALHPDLGAALGGERFLSEIRTTARLQHPHSLPLLDSGEADGPAVLRGFSTPPAGMLRPATASGTSITGHSWVGGGALGGIALP